MAVYKPIKVTSLPSTLAENAVYFVKGASDTRVKMYVTDTTGTAFLVGITSEADVLNTVLNGFTVGSNTSIASSDSILDAFGKTQGQLNALATTVNEGIRVPDPIDCSTNPNYPASTKGDSYLVTVAGRIGGASGVIVDVGDKIICLNTNAGGTQAQVGSDFYILESNFNILSIAKGGTNSSTALNNNRVMISSGGAIVEASAITANRAVITNANGIPVASAVTNTELGHLSGVTSAIQTQLNNKLESVNLGYTPSATNGIVTNSGGDNATIPLANGTNAGLFSSAEKTKLTDIETGANNYVHPTGFSNQPTDALTGASVISRVLVNNEGHVTGVDTRNLTAANIGAVTGTGTAGQVSFWTGAGTQGGDSRFNWDDTNRKLIVRRDANLSSIIELRSGINTINTNGGGITFQNLSSSASDGGGIAKIFFGTGNLIDRGFLGFATSSTSNDPILRWSILQTGILQSNGAQTIQTSTGNLTLATAAGNGNILLSPHGTGNVGIGTTSPSGVTGRVLEINGASGQARLVLKNNTSGSSATSGFQIGIAGNADAFVNNQFNASLSFATNATERMRITSAGNVGIGTTSPNGRLHVSGADGVNDIVAIIQQTANFTAAGLRITANNDGGAGFNSIISNTNGGTEHWRISGAGSISTFAIRTGGTERMRITSAGNVGIGTASPQVRLDFGESVNQAFHLYSSGVDYYGINMRPYDGQGFSTNIFSGNGGFIKFRTISGSSEQITRMTINSTGNVGIGTTSPTRLLNVNGAMRLNAIAEPTTGLNAGDMYYDSTLNRMRFRRASDWVDMGMLWAETQW